MTQGTHENTGSSRAGNRSQRRIPVSKYGKLVGGNDDPQVVIRAKISELKERGLSFSEIGRMFGISKQRACFLFHSKLTTGQKVRSPDDSKPREPLLLTSAEAARCLGVHANTIRRWNDAGLIGSYRIGDRGDRRFRIEDVRRLKARLHPDSPNFVRKKSL
jgi:excisionase family DNA binding protein